MLFGQFPKKMVKTFNSPTREQCQERNLLNPALSYTGGLTAVLNHVINFEIISYNANRSPVAVKNDLI